MLVIAGIVGSFGIVFWQLFDYEKFSEMENKDFLESKHFFKIDNSQEKAERYQSGYRKKILEIYTG